jgi:hypothetical protein
MKGVRNKRGQGNTPRWHSSAHFPNVIFIGLLMPSDEPLVSDIDGTKRSWQILWGMCDNAPKLRAATPRMGQTKSSFTPCFHRTPQDNHRVADQNNHTKEELP